MVSRMSMVTLGQGHLGWERDIYIKGVRRKSSLEFK